VDKSPGAVASIERLDSASANEETRRSFRGRGQKTRSQRWSNTGRETVTAITIASWDAAKSEKNGTQRH
jgi:hypothetical protein